MNREDRVKNFLAITDWIDSKYGKLTEEDQKLEERFCLTIVYWYDGWLVKFSDDVIMSEEELEWDDKTDNYVDVTITLEKKFQKYLKYMKQISKKFLK